jgi:prolyl 4-hydroxylase
LPRSQTVKCIEDRARTFQGWRPNTFIEKLWSQRYGVGGHYTYHYDWSTAKKNSGRVSSFMVYVDGQCEGGGTHFPRLEKPKDKSWCSFIECDVQGAYGSLSSSSTADDNDDAENETLMTKPSRDRPQEDLNQGVIFKPIPGNAVYWENMRADGSGFAESWHAGLPVTKGEKIGLNIWSWMVDGYVPPLDQVQQQQDRLGEEQELKE